METIFSEVLAGLITIVVIITATLIKAWSDLQSLKKDVIKLEKQQEKDDEKFDKIMTAITDIKQSIAGLIASNNAN